MSEQPYEDDNEDTGEREPNFRRKLEADAKAGREASAALEAAQSDARAAQRELAMRRVGVDLDHPVGALFAKAYDGEIDVDMIRDQWEKLRAGTSGTGSEVPPADQAAMARIAAAASGGTPSAGGGQDFEAALDTIPIIVDGQYNPNYVGQVLAKTQEQAIREGVSFNVIGSSPTKYAQGGGASTPATTPLRGD